MKTTYQVMTAPYPSGLVVTSQAEFCLVQQKGLEIEVKAAYIPGKSNGVLDEMRRRFQECADTMNDESVPKMARQYSLSSLRLALGDLPRAVPKLRDTPFGADFGRMDIGVREGSHGRGDIDAVW